MITEHPLPTDNPAADPSALAPSPTLTRLLDDELRFSPSFRGVYSNHLAMALVALHQLGAPASVLEATFDAHARGESEPRDDRAILDERRREVDATGIDATVRRRIPTLVEAPDTALFHPLIRLGYALDVGHTGQVAAALLDWERRRHVLPVPTQPAGSRRMADVAADLARHRSGTWPVTFDLDGTARRPELSDALAGLHTADATVDDVSTFALHAHVTADAFVTLHLVTGARALRAVSERLDGETTAALVAHTLPAMAVAYAAVGAPPLLDGTALDRRREMPLPSRSSIADLAVASPDPHVIKLANVALVEEARTADPLYRYIAARVVGALA